jgi:hypothetical protein
MAMVPPQLLDNAYLDDSVWTSSAVISNVNEHHLLLFSHVRLLHLFPQQLMELVAAVRP